MSVASAGYAPASAVTCALRPVTRPSRVPASSTSWICARPWFIEFIVSERVSTYRTGPPSSRASATVTAASGYAPMRAPNPPPVAGEITRRSSGAIPRHGAIASRWPWAPWLGVHSTRPPGRSGSGAAR